MSLALVHVPVADFQSIYTHVSTQKPTQKAAYRNMHLRERCQRNGLKDLRYLHAMYASPTSAEIEGMISGPNVFWHYRLRVANAQTQIQVLVQQSTARDAVRIQRRFLLEIQTRIRQEQAGTQHYPRLTPGQFYLRRRIPGINRAHANCRAAVANGSLDQRFVSQLHGWNLELLHP